MDDLKQRIIEISKKLKLSHIGSNISCLPILEEIYAKKKPEDIVILDNAHAHLAHLVVKQYKNQLHKPKDFDSSHWVQHYVNSYGIHCDRRAGCDASGGSLGHGIGIGIGYALADRKRDVYVIVSDGSMMEGSNWEAIRIARDLRLTNLKIHCNFNGYTAVANLGKLGVLLLKERMEDFWIDLFTFHDTDNGEGFEGIQGHYKVL